MYISIYTYILSHIGHVSTHSVLFVSHCFIMKKRRSAAQRASAAPPSELLFCNRLLERLSKRCLWRLVESVFGGFVGSSYGIHPAINK